MLGVPIQFALSSSLVKRIPDFMLGVPGLLAWHGLETRRLLCLSGRDAITSRYLTRRAVITAFWKSAVIAEEMPCVGLTAKKRPGEAQLCIFGLMSTENGLMY